VKLEQIHQPAIRQLHGGWRVLAASFLFLASSLATNAAAPLYTITEIGVLPGGTASFATAINTQGDVVGYSYNAGLDERAFLWRNGILTNLGTFPNAHYSLALGLNNLGQIVGDSDAGDFEPRAFLRETGPLLDLSRTGGAQIHASAINDAGLIAGYMTKSGSGNPANFRAVIWEKDPARPGRFNQTTLPVLTNTTDPTMTFSLAYAINASGFIAGSCYTFPTGQRGVLWLTNASRTIVDLGVLPGGGESFAEGLNGNGIAVGWSSLPDGDRAVLWRNDTARTIVNLNTLPADTDSQAHGINSAGAVVGTSFGPTNSRAFLWQSGVMQDLNALADAAALGWTLTSGHAINDAGVIVGAGIHNGLDRAFVLTPIPAPRLADPRRLNVTTFAFTLLAATNRTYRIESTLNLSNWTERLRLTNPPATGTVTLPIAPGELHHFFRAVTP